MVYDLLSPEFMAHLIIKKTLFLFCIHLNAKYKIFFPFIMSEESVSTSTTQIPKQSLKRFSELEELEELGFILSNYIKISASRWR